MNGLDILEWMDKKRAADTKEAVLRRQRHTARLYAGAVAFVVLIIGLIYSAKSRTIYFWDNATYWDMSRAILSGSLKGSFWSSVYSSICSNDYNYLAALLPAAWMRIFGTARISYVAGLITMYLIPSLMLIYRLAEKLSKAPKTAFTAAVCLVPSMLFIAESGYADVGGLIMMLGCYNLYFTDKEREDDLVRYIGIGALLVLMMIFRRYYSFFAVSFMTAMAMDCIVFRKKWVNLLITGATAAVILVVFFMPFVTYILLKNYSELYSDYKFPVATDLRFITRYFGLVFIAFAAAVPFASYLRRRDHRPVFVWIQLLVCAIMFISTQTHSIHHMLLYVPAFVLLAIFLVNCISDHRQLVIVAILALCNVISPYVKRQQPGNIQEIAHISALPSFSMRPPKRENVYDVVKLKRKLDTYIPQGAVCSVMASSFAVNDSALRNCEASLNLKQTRDGGYIVALPDVDSRDSGRLDEIYNAEYILVAFPAQTHLAPESQTIITEGVRSFENYADIAMSFEEIEAFDEYVGDTELKLYHRTEDINAIWRNEFQKRLFK